MAWKLHRYICIILGRVLFQDIGIDFAGWHVDCMLAQVLHWWRALTGPRALTQCLDRTARRALTAWHALTGLDALTQCLDRALTRIIESIQRLDRAARRALTQCLDRALTCLDALTRPRGAP
jgi:hypothetical protein